MEFTLRPIPHRGTATDTDRRRWRGVDEGRTRASCAWRVVRRWCVGARGGELIHGNGGVAPARWRKYDGGRCAREHTHRTDGGAGRGRCVWCVIVWHGLGAFWGTGLGPRRPLFDVCESCARRVHRTAVRQGAERCRGDGGSGTVAEDEHQRDQGAVPAKRLVRTCHSVLYLRGRDLFPRTSSSKVPSVARRAIRLDVGRVAQGQCPTDRQAARRCARKVRIYGPLTWCVTAPASGVFGTRCPWACSRGSVAVSGSAAA